MKISYQCYIILKLCKEKNQDDLESQIQHSFDRENQDVCNINSQSSNPNKFQKPSYGVGCVPDLQNYKESSDSATKWYK